MMKFHGRQHCGWCLPKLTKRLQIKAPLSTFLSTSFLLCVLPDQTDGFRVLLTEPDWRERLGKLRAEALDRLFPRLAEILEAIDPFGFGFVDYRDPLELISFITLFLPAEIFMLNVLFHMLPHVLNFLLFIPKLWFFNLPCLYAFNSSPFKRVGGWKRHRKRDDSSINDDILIEDKDETTNPCESANLNYITRLAYEGLVKLFDQLVE